MHNLSKYKLTDLELMTLGMGLKFVPDVSMSGSDIQQELFKAVDTLQRKLLLAFFYGEKFEPDEMIPVNETKPKWTPQSVDFPYDSRNMFSRISTACDDIRANIRKKVSTVSHQIGAEDQLLLKIIERMAKIKSIHIKPTDKNLGLAVMDLDMYIKMCKTHLDDVSTYEPTTFDLDKRVSVRERLSSILAFHSMLFDESGKSTKLAESLLQVSAIDARAAAFYCNPKLHKWNRDTQDCPPGRPIASTNGTQTEATSKWLDKQLRRVLPFINRTICHSTHDLVLAVEGINDDIRAGKTHPLTDDDWVLLCLDVRALYPSIPIKWGIQRVRQVCESSGLIPQSELNLIIDLLTWVLENNFVEFYGSFWQQKSGTAMGTPVAVIYSIIVLFSMEAPLTRHMLLYLRYIDDVFSIVRRAHAEEFIVSFQAICKDIQFDIDGSSPLSLLRDGVMLDSRITINANGLLDMSLFQKKLNKYQYIPAFSQHEEHIYVNFIHNERIRNQILNSDRAKFEEMDRLFRERLLARGYTEAMLNKAWRVLPSRDSLIAGLRRKALARQSKAKSNKLPPKLILHARLPLLPKALKLSELVQLPDSITLEREFRIAFGDERRVTLAKLPLKNLTKYLVRSRLQPDPSNSE
jgi:hypothetical protein